MKIVIDAMGGDNAPQATVEGAVQAINEYGIDIILTGDKEQIEKELESKAYDKNKLEIIHTTQIIENEDKPVMAVRRKKDSSMVVALNLVKEKSRCNSSLQEAQELTCIWNINSRKNKRYR